MFKETYDNCWQYFKNKDKEAVICNICSKQISCKSSSTSGLHRHLEHVHSMKRKLKENPNSPKSKKLRPSVRIDKFFESKGPTLNEIVAKLAAKDGLTISQICKSDFIRKSLKSQGFTLSKQSRDVMKLIFDFYDQVKEETIAKIKKMKLENKKASISIDEWTSFNNRRYLNIHVYYIDEDSDNLGLVRIVGSCISETLLQLVAEKLKCFGLDYAKDIVATTTDGASVMLKFGRLSGSEMQLCYSHAVQLSIMAVFYSKQKETNFEEEIDDNSSNEDDVEEYQFLSEHFLFTNHMKINDTITIIRKIVKMFKASPVKNSILQKYIMDAEKKELSLLLDCRTRWSSLQIMVERFLRVLDPIQKALIEMDMGNIWKLENTYTAKCILNTLSPLKIAIEALGRIDANLLTGEGVLKFLFNALRVENSDLSNKLLNELQVQISKRRNRSTVSLLKFLQDLNQVNDTEDDFFRSPSKPELIKLAKSYMRRLFSVGNKSDDSHSESECELVVPNGTNRTSLEQQLEDSIQVSLKKSQPVGSNFKTLTKEFNLFEVTGKLTPNLDRLKDALMSIKPSTTQNERNFSTSGYIVSKRRTKLKDASIDCLCFLKHYFQKKSCNTD